MSHRLINLQITDFLPNPQTTVLADIIVINLFTTGLGLIGLITWAMLLNSPPLGKFIIAGNCLS